MQRGLNPIKTLVGLGLRNRKRLAGGGRRERVKRLEDSERLRRLLAAPIFPLLSLSSCLCLWGFHHRGACFLRQMDQTNTNTYLFFGFNFKTKQINKSNCNFFFFY